MHVSGLFSPSLQKDSTGELLTASISRESLDRLDWTLLSPGILLINKTEKRYKTQDKEVDSSERGFNAGTEDQICVTKHGWGVCGQLSKYSHGLQCGARACILWGMPWTVLDSQEDLEKKVDSSKRLQCRWAVKYIAWPEGYGQGSCDMKEKPGRYQWVQVSNSWEDKAWKAT